jgi:hypothetical protein
MIYNEKRGLGFSMEKHVVGLMAAAGKKAPEDFKFGLKGDLNQMGLQKKVLQEHNIVVVQSDVYPVLREGDKKVALRIIWDSQVDGWWHYKHLMVEVGICTEKDWEVALESKTGESVSHPPRYAVKYFFLKGTLEECKAQREFLKQNGFDVLYSFSQPVLREEDKKAALKLIWDKWVDGWWHYKDEMIKDEMIKYGITDLDRWKAALSMKKEDEKSKKLKQEAPPLIERKINWEKVKNEKPGN